MNEITKKLSNPKQNRAARAEVEAFTYEVYKRAYGGAAENCKY